MICAQTQKEEELLGTKHNLTFEISIFASNKLQTYGLACFVHGRAKLNASMIKSNYCISEDTGQYRLLAVAISLSIFRCLGQEWRRLLEAAKRTVSCSFLCLMHVRRFELAD